MTREELRNYVEEQRNLDVIPYHVYSTLVDGIDTLEQEPKTEWIPVTERLPKEENKSYWICTDCGYQCECRWTNVNHIWTYLTTDWHWHIMDVPQYSKVIAWMPLPEPYKAESEVQNADDRI